jgi:uncharacterized protein (TIGR02186 family)
MRHKNSIIKAAVVFHILVIFLLFLSVGVAFAQLTVQANHSHIKIGFFYHGGTVSLRGISDPDTDIVLKLTSADGHQTLRKKGKVGGFLWMNVGELEVEHAPNVYFVNSTKNIKDILTREEMDKYVIGYPALKKHVSMNASGEENQDMWFREFVKFREASNLYAATAGKISLTEKDGSQHYYILTQWPYQAPPGNYTVTAYAVRDKKVIETATAGVSVEQAGLVKSFATMAKNNAAVYGILSILVALCAGFGVGLVFRKSGGAH